MGKERNDFNGLLAREFHTRERPGKIEVIPTKPYFTRKHLRCAYYPGGIAPSVDILDHPLEVYRYTAKGNLVGIVTNGTDLPDIGQGGALAAKPIMEGKVLLFKTLADIDSFDLELSVTNPEEFVSVVSSLADTFGAICLENIKAPECFEIEERLQAKLDIPVLHDHRHGIAVTAAAALLNALRINGKKMEELRMVVCGGGSAAQATIQLYVDMGMRRENIQTSHDGEGLSDALNGADVFLGFSQRDLLTADMLEGMAQDPVVFALATPLPEIRYERAMNARHDLIFATCREEFPNCISTLASSPYLLRGALDVRAQRINSRMQLDAARAIADLACFPVPEEIVNAYGEKRMEFGRSYLLPKPLDYRLMSEVSFAVAKAAIQTGEARVPLPENYKRVLQKRLDDIRGICYRCKRGVAL